MAQDGRYPLRLADNEAATRKSFPGCVWFPADERFRVPATFVPYPAGETIRVVNVRDQVSQEPSPGFAEFALGGTTHRLDAVGDGDGLLFVFTDPTAGDTTYAAARFLTVEKRPAAGGPFTLDFNRAYNPPCAFSEFTTCPTAPPAEPAAGAGGGGREAAGEVGAGGRARVKPARALTAERVRRRQAVGPASPRAEPVGRPPPASPRAAVRCEGVTSAEVVDRSLDPESAHVWTPT